MAPAAIAFCLTDVAVMIETHWTKSSFVDDRLSQRRHRSACIQLGMALQAIVFGGESRSPIAMAGATGRPVLFRGSM